VIIETKVGLMSAGLAVSVLALPVLAQVGAEPPVGEAPSVAWLVRQLASGSGQMILAVVAALLTWSLYRVISLYRRDSMAAHADLKLMVDESRTALQRNCDSHDNLCKALEKFENVALKCHIKSEK